MMIDKGNSIDDKASTWDDNPMRKKETENGMRLYP
jgi:hypothetical protein